MAMETFLAFGLIVVKMAVVIGVLLALPIPLTWIERKIAGHIQQRLGPMRVGWHGLLQPLADGLKLLTKEDHIPTNADRFLFTLAPIMALVPPFVVFAVIPFGDSVTIFGTEITLYLADMNVALLFVLGVAGIEVMGVILAGWASNSKYAVLGSLRTCAQMISYEIPMGLCLLCVILAAGSVRPYEIVSQQLAGGEWFIIHLPIVAILFFVCLLAESNRAPFDLAEAEQELIGGWHTEYSSLKWALFFMGEYIHMVVGAAFFTLLFLGGWSLNPLGIGWDLPMSGGILLILLQFGVILGKVFALVFLVMMIRWTLPRFRFDQLMRLAWEGMIPTTMLLLMMTSLFIYMGWLDYLWLGSLGALVIIYFVRPLMPRQANPNHKVPLIGSRFSPLIESESAGIDEIDTHPTRSGI